MGLVQSRAIVGLLIVTMGATASWRLGQPPLSQREEIMLNRAYSLVNIGRYGYAYVRFRKVLSINAFNDEARTMLDILNIYGYLLRKKPSPSTLARYEKTREQKPGSPYVYMIGGELKLAAGDTASAIRLHLRAAEIKPDLPHNWYGLGMAYRAAGLHDEALDALQRAADSDTRALYDLDLGHQLFHARNFNAASRAFRRTHEKAPRLIDGDIGETRSLLLAGSYEEALRTAESLIMKLDTTSSKQNRRAPHVSLASDSEDFEMVRGLDLETLRDYVIRLHRWAQDLSTGIPIDPSLAGLPVQSPLLPVLRLDVSLLL